MHTFFDLNLNPAKPDVISFVGGGGKTTTLFRLAHEIDQQGKRVVTTTTTHIGPDQLQHAPTSIKMVGDILPVDELLQAFEQANHCLLISDQATERKVSGISPDIVDLLAEQAVDLGIAAILIEADGARKRPIKAPKSYEPPMPKSTTLLVPVMGLDALGSPITEAYVHRPEQIRTLLGLNNQLDKEARITPEMAAELLTHPNGGAKNRPENARLMPILNKVDNVPRLAGARLIAQALSKRGYPSLITAVGTAPAKPVLERHGPTATVILAAGASHRMGQAKQLLSVDGTPDGDSMLLRAVHTALESQAEQVVVVTGAYAEVIEQVLAPLKKHRPKRLQTIYNSDWETGQSSSVKSALHVLPTHIRAVSFLPVDQPFIPAHLLNLLRRAWQQGALIVAPTLDGNLRGAPALFDRQLWPELMKLEGDQGARPILKKYADVVIPIPAAGQWLQDIDTPEAYESYLLQAN